MIKLTFARVKGRKGTFFFSMFLFFLFFAAFDALLAASYSYSLGQVQRPLAPDEEAVYTYSGGSIVESSIEKLESRGDYAMLSILEKEVVDEGKEWHLLAYGEGELLFAGVGLKLDQNTIGVFANAVPLQEGPCYYSNVGDVGPLTVGESTYLCGGSFDFSLPLASQETFSNIGVVRMSVQVVVDPSIDLLRLQPGSDWSITYRGSKFNLGGGLLSQTGAKLNEEWRASMASLVAVFYFVGLAPLLALGIAIVAAAASMEGSSLREGALLSVLGLSKRKVAAFLFGYRLLEAAPPFLLSAACYFPLAALSFAAIPILLALGYPLQFLILALVAAVRSSGEARKARRLIAF